MRHDGFYAGSMGVLQQGLGLKIAVLQRFSRALVLGVGQKVQGFGCKVQGLDTENRAWLCFRDWGSKLYFCSTLA